MSRFRVRRVAACAVVLAGMLSAGLAATPALAAQAGEQPAATAVQVQPSIEDSLAAEGFSGLPQRPREPRTLADFWQFFAGFAVIWVGIVGYSLTFNSRVKRIGDAVAAAGAQGRSDVSQV